MQCSKILFCAIHTGKFVGDKTKPTCQTNENFCRQRVTNLSA